MRKFDFENESNIKILEIKTLIEKMIMEKYTIDKILELLNITRLNYKKIMEYKYKVPAMNFEPKSYFSEEDLLNGINNYTYESLSPAEKSIFNNLKLKS